MSNGLKSFGITGNDVHYIMETFPIVKRKEEAKFGEFRTNRVILEMYDQMKTETESGEAYQTELDPSPADERAAYTET